MEQLHPEFVRGPEAPNPMGTAALICGILSIATLFVGGSLVFGSLGVMFAMLSRIRYFSGTARAGLITSAIGLGITGLCTAAVVVFLTVESLWGTVFTLAQELDPSDPASTQKFQQELQDAFTEKLYGKTYDELLEEYGAVLTPAPAQDQEVSL